MNKILVTGSNGQLGSAIKKISRGIENLEFLFTDEKELDITNPDKVEAFFMTHQPNYCVNCAAYTAVDKAEMESDLAFKINRLGVDNLVNACKVHDTVLIQVSTDFVFDGNKNTPYYESDLPNPINVYGKSKLEAEQSVIRIMDKYFIIRTAWVYSEFGTNFLKTMIRLGQENDEIKVVNDQFGSPTYAGDLASFIILLIKSENKEYGVFHYTNKGIITWYKFAKQILKLNNPKVNVIPIASDKFPTAAIRPKNSALNLGKTMLTFEVEIPEWNQSLRECLKQIRLSEIVALSNKNN